MYITKDTNVLVQGITGRHGRFHTAVMKKNKTNVVAGVTPGKGGQTVKDVPVYNTVAEACKEHQLEWSILFVPAQFVKSAAYEALDAGLHLIIISEHVPIHDAIAILKKAKEEKKHVFGPNCPGMIIPGETKLGIMPDETFSPGSVGVVSRSGTLTYEVCHQLSQANRGQSAVIGIGGDPVVGMHFTDVLAQFESDERTKCIVLIGEIGGSLEETAAHYIKKNISKPVIAFIAGKTAPKGKTMGHAGAIIQQKAGSASYKMSVFEQQGIPVAYTIAEIVQHIKKLPG